MFFVDKKNKNSKNPVLQLITSIRVDGKPRQDIVVSLGSDFKIPKKLRKDVARVITDKLKGQLYFAKPTKIEKLADKVIRRIQESGNTKYLKERNKKEDIQEVYVDQVGHTDDRIAGPLVIGHSMWEKIGMSEILGQCGFSNKQTKIAEISILNRLISQDCEYAIPSWTKAHAVADLVYHKAEFLSKDSFYRISDKLIDNKDKIEKKLYQNVKSFFRLKNSILLYDLTNTYFEGQSNLIPKAEFNKNQKEKRTDCPQIVIALIIDKDGFVVHHKVFNGKMSVAKSLKRILNSIKRDYSEAKNKPTLIFDRGVTSEANINLLNSSDFKYIIASRNNTENENVSDFIEGTFTTIKEDKGNTVEVLLKKEKGENYLLCRSSGRKDKESAMRSMREESMLKKLASLKKRTFIRKNLPAGKVDQSIGRIREKYSSVAKYYNISYKPWKFDYEIRQNTSISKRIINIVKNRKEKYKNNKISYKNLKADIDKYSEKYSQDFAAININLTKPKLSYGIKKEQLEKEKALEGNYLLRTNRDDLDEKQIWKIYTLLTRVEYAFRHLKTDLGLRPNYHHLGTRVDGHVFISILAYQILNSIEYTLRQKKYYHSWAIVKRLMMSYSYSSIILPTVNGKTLRIRKPGIPEATHKSIFKKLAIDYENLPSSKIII